MGAKRPSRADTAPVPGPEPIPGGCETVVRNRGRQNRLQGPGQSGAVEGYDTCVSAQSLESVLGDHAARALKHCGAGVVLEIPNPPRVEQPEL